MQKAASINIKNREAADLIGRIRAKTGKGASQIVVELLRGEAARLAVAAPADAAARLRRLRAIADRAGRKLKASGRRLTSADIDALYDSRGLPK